MLFNVHFPAVPLEIADRALIQLGLRAAYALEATDIFAQTPEHLSHGACLLFDVACVEGRICLKRAKAVHDCAVDRLTSMYGGGRWRKWETDHGRWSGCLYDRRRRVGGDN